MTNSFAIVIPARLNSTRLPKKALIDIAGKTMLHRVFEKAQLANLGDVLIACDGEEIANEARKINASFIITDPNLPSGTDRVFSALEKAKKNYRYIINLQGDLPNVEPSVIKSVANLISNDQCDIATVASKIKDSNEITNPNVVKIALNSNNRALYFSRSAIPYSKNSFDEYFHHIGIYGYSYLALKKFVNLPQSNLEKRESLEQLRALENDMIISVAIVDSHPLSVDTIEDLQIIKKIILNNEKKGY